MNKAELVAAIASETGLMKTDCEKALASLTSNITESLKKGDDVKILGFGNFSVQDRVTRTGRNPRTGDEIQIAACKVPGFKAGKEFKATLNG